MTLGFTICSNNYLAHAKTLGDSFLKYHPDAKFVIGLVDRLSDEIDYSQFELFTILPVENLKIAEFDELLSKYNITELNTAVKPSYIHYLFKNYAVNKLLYIDPDIMVMSRFDEVIDKLDTENIVLTPHICTPIDDEFAPTDYHTLRGGIFNLGFIALSNYPEIITFIDWWHQRVIKYGFADFSQTMFYDQLWINYVPVMFEKYFILKHPGYNMANWNFHERYLTKDAASKYLVNGTFPLRFFHFSSYKFSNPGTFCSYNTRFNFKNRPDLVEIFELYQSNLIQNSVQKISKAKVYFYPLLNSIPPKLPKPTLLKRVFKRVKLATKVFVYGQAN